MLAQVQVQVQVQVEIADRSEIMAASSHTRKTSDEVLIRRLAYGARRLLYVLIL